MPINRNDPCPCGSGKKFKKCCMGGRSSGGSAVAVDPATAVAHARSHLQANRLDEATRLYRQILAHRPGDHDALVGLSVVLDRKGDLESAAGALGHAVESPAATAETWVRFAGVLQRADRSEESLTAAERASELDDDSVLAHHLIAVAHERANRIVPAIEAARRAVELDHSFATAAIMLSLLEGRAGHVDEAIARLQDVIEREAQPETLFRAYKELGRLLEKTGEHDAAFEAYARGGEARARTPEMTSVDGGVDAGMWGGVIRQYDAGLTRALCERWSIEAIGDVPMRIGFLVGFPRSGTTMTEQVMAAHPDVVSTDEQPLVHQLVQDLTGAPDGGDDLVGAIESLDAMAIRQHRDRYREMARKLGGTDLAGQVFLDKVPLNLIHLGFINVVFPEAKVIVALRDPRDVCLSCFAQRFGLNNAMANFVTWEGTAVFYAQVMEFWLDVRERITLGLLTVRYEDTVTDLEGQSRRLLDHLGLPWNDDVLRFHEKARQRVISTPSYAAVTETVHSRAIGRWKAHAHRYDELGDRLTRCIEAFGYA